MSEASDQAAPGIAPGGDRPDTALRRSWLPLFAFLAIALTGGTALYAALDVRRCTITAPAIRPSAGESEVRVPGPALEFGHRAGQPIPGPYIWLPVRRQNI